MKILVRGLIGVALLSAGGLLLTSHFDGDSVCWGCSTKGHHHHAESPPWRKLRTLHSAEADFRDNDRDSDGLKQFWRADVASLYGFLPRGSTEMIKLIDISVASADLNPLPGGRLGDQGPGPVDLANYSVACPREGYWFASLRFEDEERGMPDPDRFAFCAVPDSLSAGTLVYAVTQEGVVWQAQARCARDVPRAFPLDPLKAGWQRKSP